jgi:hypothetical protein
MIFHEVLYFYDEPLIFTTIFGGDLYLCIKIGEDENINKYFVVLTSQNIIDKLINNEITLRSAFYNVSCWIMYHNFKIGKSMFIISSLEDAIENKYLPEPKTHLYPKIACKERTKQ